MNSPRVKRVERKLEKARLSAVERIARAGPKAIETLEALLSAEDERARYSAASKLTDMLLPRQQAPLVQINMGENLKSHLALPPPPPETIDVTPQVKGKSAVEIVRREIARRAAIGPEESARRDWMRKRFDVLPPAPPTPDEIVNERQPRPVTIQQLEPAVAPMREPAGPFQRGQVKPQPAPMTTSAYDDSK